MKSKSKKKKGKEIRKQSLKLECLNNNNNNKMNVYMVRKPARNLRKYPNICQYCQHRHFHFDIVFEMQCLRVTSYPYTNHRHQ